jgi:hypothetical protein
MRSVEKWRAYTNESNFATEFANITKLYQDDNELRT